MLDGVSAANRNRLKQQLAKNPELAPYTEKILPRKARRFVDKKNQMNQSNVKKVTTINMKKPFLITLIMLATYHTASAQKSGMLVRLSEIEIYRDSLATYKAILKEEAEASVRLEPGVISIFPMYQQKDYTQVRLLEIYANREAYESHLKSPHFKRYKTTTLSMVKSLQLIDMTALDPETMPAIFAKLKIEKGPQARKP